MTDEGCHFKSSQVSEYDISTALFIKAIKSGDVNTVDAGDDVVGGDAGRDEGEKENDNCEQTENSSKQEEKNNKGTKKSFAQIRSLNRKYTMNRNTIASGSEQQCNVL